MANFGIKSSQLSDIRSALLETSKNNNLEQKSDENFGNQIKDALDSVANAQETSKTLAQNFELGKESICFINSKLKFPSSEKK